MEQLPSHPLSIFCLAYSVVYNANINPKGAVHAFPEILECLEKDFAYAMGVGDETKASDQPPRNALSPT